MTEPHLRETAASYDCIVASYEAQVATAAAQRTAFLNRFVAAVARGGLVVDAGCRPGVDVSRFSGSGLRSTGVDASTGMAP